MLFNRIDLFNQNSTSILNLTDTPNSTKWKSILNGTTYHTTTIATMIFNSSDIMPDHQNGSGNLTKTANVGKCFHQDPLPFLIFISISYLFVLVAGILGNVITCAVIYRNKSMHTATNYYLFNLAISDLMLLLSGEFVCLCWALD